ncbi:hypothetical protein ACIBK8_25695 [Streptomyces sp. NPDC050161]|uniref:hypothetical protein n=1 Tax=Streptomyces sp. NPDC050161 TaxID=3365604 RepID=UPI0037AAC3BD
MPDPQDTRDLAAFAATLADELPGRWTCEHHQHSAPEDLFASAQDVWDMNLVSAALAEHVLVQDAFLIREDGARLYVISRPNRRGAEEEFLVAAMAPAGFTPEAFRGVREPDGILVPDDPFRAADDITVDLLPRYDKAVAKVQRNADLPEQAERVVMTYLADGVLAAQSTGQETDRALRGAGFTWDPHKMAFVVPGDDPGQQARCVRKAQARLAYLNTDVTVRSSPPRSALETTAAAPAPRAAQSASRTR